MRKRTTPLDYPNGWAKIIICVGSAIGFIWMAGLLALQLP